MAFGNYGMGFYPQNGMYNPAAPTPMAPAPDMLAQFKMPYQQQAAQNQGGFIWVQGEEAAKAYLVAPGNTVTLWDTERNVIYIKSADATGLPSMRILDWTEHAEKTPAKPTEHVCNCSDKFATKEDFEVLKADVERLTKRLETPPKPKSRIMKHEEDEDE